MVWHEIQTTVLPKLLVATVILNIRQRQKGKVEQMYTSKNYKNITLKNSTLVLRSNNFHLKIIQEQLHQITDLIRFSCYKRGVDQVEMTETTMRYYHIYNKCPRLQ